MAPDVFGTKAVKIKSVPLAAKYPRLEHIDVGQSFGSINEINRWVNRNIKPRQDEVDTWQTAAATWLLKTGDCEDLALLKESLLLQNNLADKDQIFLVTGRDLALRSDHAMLVVATGGEFLVLDNMHSKVLPDTAYTDFKPLVSFSRAGIWIHGKAVT